MSRAWPAWPPKPAILNKPDRTGQRAWHTGLRCRLEGWEREHGGDFSWMSVGPGYPHALHTTISTLHTHTHKQGTQGDTHTHTQGSSSTRTHAPTRRRTGLDVDAGNENHPPERDNATVEPPDLTKNTLTGSDTVAMIHVHGETAYNISTWGDRGGTDESEMG